MKKRRYLKKGLAILLTAAMVVGLMPGLGTIKVSAAQTVYSAPSTDTNGVYQISTAEELYWFAQYVNEGHESASAVLTQDISASSMSQEWTPIGSSDQTPFSGTFDGQGHTISGLKVTGNAYYVGLFGYIMHARVTNVGVKDSSFQGEKYVGGICGKTYRTSDSTEIINCYSMASVSGTMCVGGLCGFNQKALIINCFSAGTVTGGDSLVGGFCGASEQLSEFNCYYLSENRNGYCGTHKSRGQFTSGEVAYLLSNGYQYFDSFKSGDIWGQSIGTDGLPVFNGEEVFYAGGQYHNHAQEYCSLCSGEPSQKNGVYQLYTVENLYWFAGLVNGTTSGLTRNASAKAVLCSDIIINKDVTDTSGLQAWTPIGTQTTPYTGTLDGQGHTISGLYVEDSEYGGLFGNTGESAAISNVGVINSKISATTAAGGICGENGGTIQDCYHTGTISSSGTAGGICGTNNGTVKDCYSTGSISGSTVSGGIYGQTSGAGITNCYYLTDGETNLSDGTAGKTREQFESGEVCYLLNGSRSEGNLTWGQVIGRDAAPLFGEKTVFYARSQYHNHTGDDCSLCAGDRPEQIDGVYQLCTADDLYWFAGLVNGTLSYTTKDTKAKAVLRADITVNAKVIENGSLVDTSGLRKWTPIGTSESCFNGTFDGGGHTISGLYLEAASDYVGLFGVTSGASISNVTVADSYLSGKNYVGGVIGSANGGTITDCHNTESVCVSGTELVGGITGKVTGGVVKNSYNIGSVNGTYHVGGVTGLTSNATVTDCYNRGSVSGNSYVGGITGKVTGGVVKNSYSRGSVSGTDWVGAVAGFVSGGTVQNCYYLSDSETDSIAGTGCKTGAQFGSGEVAWLLNANRTPIIWGQNIGVDAYPVLNGPQVYATYPCLSFSNTPFASENKEHSYGAGGTCTVCGDASKPDMVDGVYQISNEAQLYWFAGLVNGTLSDGTEKNASAKAVLTSDITVNRGVLNADGSLAATSGFKEWKPIGTSYNGSFKGTFDGQGHTISGLYLDTASDYVGLFGFTHVASISNVTVADSYLAGNESVGGVIGHALGGSVTNCSNEGSVRGTSYYVGGVIGQTEADDNTGKITVTNCHNTGWVSATGNYTGGVIGELFKSTEITGCYNTGSVSGAGYVGGVAGRTGHIGIMVTGCYNTGSVSGTGNEIGGVLGSSQASVTACYNAGSVSGSQYVGGVIGYIYDYTATDCYNIGSVSGTDNCVGDVVGYRQGGSFKNCYYLADKETDSISGTSYKTADQFAGGEVTYRLNDSKSETTAQNPLVWYQNLGEGGDASPVFDNNHGVVYQCTGCTATYSNTENEVAKHSFKPDTSDSTKHKCEKCETTEEHSTTNLSYSANDYTNQITVSCGECGKSLGYVQLIAPSGDLTYDNSVKEATVSDAVAGIDFSSTAIVYDTADGSAPKTAGTYTASITLGAGEDSATVSVEFIIARATPDIGTVSAQPLTDTLNVSQVQLSRTDETVSGTLSLEEGTALQYGSNNCTYLFMPEDEANYKSVTGSVTVTVNDTIAPTAESQIGENPWKEFTNTISFGLFYNEYKTVKIKYSDVNASGELGSGVKTKQYYIANKELTTDEIAALQWNDYTNAISLDAEDVYFIYVKVEDHAGNRAVLNSEGIVIYKESTLSPESLDYTYKENKDLAVQITQNGNSFGKLTDASGNEIAAGNYEVDATGKLILKADYLDTLNVGEYTYKVSMNPQGQVTDKVTLAYRFVVNVKACELSVTGATATDRAYDTTKVIDITAVELSGAKSGEVVSVDTTNLTGTLTGANAGSYTSVTLPAMTLTGADAGNYTLVQPTGAVPTTVTISKADAQITIDTEKDRYSKTFGDVDFTLSGISDTNTEADVQYEVTTGNDVISVSNGTVTLLKAGTATITVSLPASTNYNAAENKTITVTVNKAPSAPGMPSGTMDVAYTIKTVSDVKLPANWSWEEIDKATELTVDKAVTATAVYTGVDKGNYETETVEIIITRLACTHATTEVKNAKDATCTGKGYSGDIYCTVCDKKIGSGQDIDALGHDMKKTVSAEVKATCTEAGKEAVMGCSRCDYTEGGAVINALGHDFAAEFTVDKEATCTEAGSKSKHCSRCAEVTEVTPIPKTEHTWDAGAVTKKATCTEKGVLTYTCEVCQETKTEDIAIDKSKHGETEIKNAKDATCTVKGYTGDTYCKDCGAKLASGTEMAMTAHKWDAGKVTKEATETAEGVKTYTCSVCGKTKTEAIPKKTTTTPHPPKKGDVVKDDKAAAKVEVTDAKKKEVAYEKPANKKAKPVSIPATVKIDGVTYKVTKIADNAFKGNKTVTKVTVGSNIKTIGKNAFSGATKLKTVKIGKNVTEIGANAFKGCSSLTSVTLPGKTTKIGANAFNGCKKLKTIKITSTKLTSKTVAKNAFKGLTKVTTIKVPKKKLAAYKRLFKQKGLSSKVKVKGY